MSNSKNKLLTKLELLKLNKRQLIKQCKKYKVSSSGNKAEMVERILKKTKRKRDKISKQKAAFRNIPAILLISYFRDIEKHLHIKLPLDVKYTIGYFIRRYIIFGCGLNLYDQFALPEKDEYIQLESWTRLRRLEFKLNDYHDIFLQHEGIIIQTSDKILYACGKDGWHRFNLVKLRDNNKWSRMKDIGNNKIITTISSGIYNDVCTLIATSDNKLHGYGTNEYGMFGNGKQSYGPICDMDTSLWLKQTHRIIDIKCGWKTTFFRTSNNDVFMCGEDENKQYVLTPILIAEDIKMIAVGSDMKDTIFLTLNGKLIKMFGKRLKISNYFENKKIDIMNVKIGSFHVCCLGTCGDVYTFGGNTMGQCGNEINECIIDEPFYVNINEVIIDIQCGGYHTVLLSKDNSLYIFGNNEDLQCSVVFAKKKCIKKPYRFMKKKELGYNYWIQKVFAMCNETLIFVNPYKWM
eukprot:552482_1